MRFIADFHIHSKYSRATSKQMDLDNLSESAKFKGIDLLGTGDFTHHLWLEELKEKLTPAGNGIYQYGGTKYILTTEVSNIYSKFGKVRKIHNMIFAPSFSTVDKLNRKLEDYGNLTADGRPILSLDSEKFFSLVKDIDENCQLVPCHIWTPWFSLFGANSGFDLIEECFGDLSDEILALETGLSSDPAMNWRWSSLDKYSLISNSDAHCLHPNTNIYIAEEKPKPVKDLNPSKVLSIDFKNNLEQREAAVSKLHKLSSPPVLYKIKTRSKEIIVTPEHRFFALENEEVVEKKAFELKKDDLVACIRQITNKGRSQKLPSLTIEHEIKLSPQGINYLRNLRINRKKTQRSIANYIGVSETWVWAFEKNKFKIVKESFIDKYCRVIKVNQDEFKKKFVIFRFPREKFPQFTNEKFCQILGYALGDGGIEYFKRRIRKFTLKDKDLNLLNSYEVLIKEIFNIQGRFRKEKKRKSNSIRYPSYLATYFQELDPKILAPSQQRQIPEFIFKLPKEEIAGFLKGLFDAEGTVGHHFIQISLSSSILVKEIQILLLRFGISSNIYPDFEKNKRKWRYKLSIYGQRQLKIFFEEIGFSSVRKKEKLFKYLFFLKEPPKSSFTDPLPIKEEILKVKRRLKVPCYDIPKRLYYHLEQNNTLKRNNVKEFLRIFSRYSESNSYLEKIKKFAQSDIIWESIIQIKKVKSNCKFVYDITVPYYENYIANGFITHNSPSRIGREANVFNCSLDYYEIIKVLKNKDKGKFLYTIEFFPQEGKYHFDGHRNCKLRLSPEQTRELKGRCPKCGRPLTMGVMHRVEKLSDRPKGIVPQDFIPFKHLIPLVEIIAEAKQMGVQTLTIQNEYRKLIQRGDNEFNILINIPFEELLKITSKRVAKSIVRIRQEDVEILPGYDGKYGEIKFLSEPEEKDRQMTLF